MEIHHNTIDQDNRPASYGIENGYPWIEFADGTRGRTTIIGYTCELRKRIRQEIVTRGIEIPVVEHSWFREEPHAEIPPIELPTQPVSLSAQSAPSPETHTTPNSAASFQQYHTPSPSISLMKNTTILSRGQDQILKTLIPYAALATNGLVDKFPIIPRTATLIAGPSGTGKTRVVTELAERLKLPLWTVNMSGWLVQGARGDTPTIHNLFEWVESNPRGIIFLDEIEKIDGASDWFSTVRLEVHDVVDARLPRSIKSPFFTAETLFDYPAESKIVIDEVDRVMGTNERIKKDAEWRRALEKKLKTRFFIVAAGAWQSEWAMPSSSIGFGQPSDVTSKTIERKNLMKAISPEILNRFRCEIAFLEPMDEDDYFNYANTLTERVPSDLQPWFAHVCLAEIENALTHQLGMRIFEEAMAKAWVDRFMHNVTNNLPQTPSQDVV